MTKQKNLLLLALTVLILLGAGPADAAPRNGMAIFFGPNSLKASDTTSGESYTTSSGGFGLGLDYQFALGQSLSLNPFLTKMSANVSFPTLPDVSLAQYDILGLQARLWLGSIFIGAHYGIYGATLVESDISIAGIGTGEGWGLDAGYEGEGEWFLTLHSDSAKGVEISDAPSIDLAGGRLNIGYRWK